ncbi:hypothetical protein PTKIN_Ptkin08bG0072400 [Pterospermum kingtungense]
MEDHILSIPLLATPAAASSPASAITTTASSANTKEDNKNGFFSSSSGVISRIILVIFIGTISIWANHEASKGFKVTIINNDKDSPAGKRFALFYVSNDEGTRIIQNTSALVENILYPADSYQAKKPVHHVILQMATNNLTTEVIVETSKTKNFAYIISLSPSLLEENNTKYAVISAIQRGMTRIWLWDGESRAPPWLIDGMEEYIWSQAGFGDYDKETTTLLYPELLKGIEPGQFCFVLSQVCSTNSNNFSSGLKLNISTVSGDGNSAKLGRLCWEDKDPKRVAQTLGYLEQQKKGYIQRLNQILRDRWDDQQCHVRAD